MKTPRQVFETEDRVLPILDLGRSVKIRVALDDDNVLLYVGPRDYQWDRKTGKWVGQGTDMPVKTKARRKKAA